MVGARLRFAASGLGKDVPACRALEGASRFSRSRDVGCGRNGRTFGLAWSVSVPLLGYAMVFPALGPLIYGGVTPEGENAP